VSGFRAGWLAWALLAGLWAHGLAQAAEPQALARQTGIDEAVVRMTLDAGSNPQPLTGAVVRGKARWAPGLTVQVAGGRAAAQAEWQRRHGIGRQPDDVSVIRAKDPFDALRVMGTGGPAYELSPPRVLAKLRDWDRRYGVQLIGAGHDWVEVRLQRLPERLRRFAVEVVEFCPDVVGDVESVDRLAEELQLTRTLHLAWGRPAWERPARPLGATLAGR
jgi:hypothetical protein